jgi:hypothetical protein
MTRGERIASNPSGAGRADPLSDEEVRQSHAY